MSATVISFNAAAAKVRVARQARFAAGALNGLRRGVLEAMAHAGDRGLCGVDSTAWDPELEWLLRVGAATVKHENTCVGCVPFFFITEFGRRMLDAEPAEDGGHGPEAA